MFDDDYIFELISNSIIPSFNLESASSKDINNVINGINAFIILTNNDKLDLDIIKKDTNEINKDEKYNSKDYRKIGKYMEGTKVLIDDPKDIKKDLDLLFYNYYNT